MSEILLDFNVIKCDCGNDEVYANTQCSVCGAQFDVRESLIDPYVALRVEKMSGLVSVINAKELELKQMRRGVSKGLILTTYLEDGYSFVSYGTHKMEEFCELEKLKDLNLKSDNLDNPEIEEKFQAIEFILNEMYTFLFALFSTETIPLWKNALNRLRKTAIAFKNAQVDFIMSAIAENYTSAIEKSQTAQKIINEGAIEIRFLGRIFELMKTDEIDIFKGGEINISASISMIFGQPDSPDININMQNFKQDIYNYYKLVLHHDIDWYLDEDIYRLAGFCTMALATFDDENFFYKMKIVVDVLEKAYQKDKDAYVEFFDSYIKKYLYCMLKVNELTNSFAFVLGNKPSDKILIQNALDWYKDLSEGIFRDSSKIVMYSAQIISNKKAEIEDLLNFVGFSDIVSYFENNEKLKLNKLIEGMEKIIRHAEAHVDYDIDDTNKILTLRNITREKQITTIQYSFLDFLELINKLAETVFAIIAGINVFLSNNGKDFADKLQFIDEELEKTISFHTAEIILPLMGITVNSIEYNITDGKKVLHICGKSTLCDNKGILEKCISFTAPIVQKDNTIDTVELELTDMDGMDIGSVRLIAEFIKESYTIEPSLKNYALLLYLKTVEVKYLNDYLIGDVDYTQTEKQFIFGILQFIMPQISKLHELEIQMNIDFKSSIDEILEICRELEYAKETVEKFIPFSDDIRIIEHLFDVVCEIASNLKKIADSEGVAVVFVRYLKVIGGCAFKIGDFAKYLSGEYGADYFYKTKTNAGIQLYKGVGVNAPCPCGSGKKYKRCCMQ